MPVTDKTSLIFQKNGSPFCQRFNDIYFDIDDAQQQSETVFIETNKIVDKLILSNNTFTIAETGFGTGLNFILTLKAYQQAQRQLKLKGACKELCKLHFISVEKYPLTKQQLALSLKNLPLLQEFCSLLLEQYPTEIYQQNNILTHECNFLGGNVALTVYFCDATEGLKQIKSPHQGLVDTWYLDGFSPNKNPDMWSNALFQQIARLSKEQACLSTFTIAGTVRRQLIEAGFRLEKVTTTGKKREIIKAKYQTNKMSGKGYQLRPKISKPQQVAIIGGGIASACAAYALTFQGVKVTLYCQDSKLAQGASSNAIGALYPLLHQQRDDISEFYERAFWRAKSLYQELLDKGFKFSHQWCGLLDISYKEALAKRQQLFESINAWPSELIHSIDQQQASAISNLPLAHGGLFMPAAGWIAPQELVTQLFAAAKATNRLKIEQQVTITEITQNDDRRWTLHSPTKTYQENILIVCAGADSIKINTINKLPLSSVRGQITSMASNIKMSKLSTVICHKGYLTPENNGIHCIGATFDKNSFDINTRNQDDDYNRNMLDECLPELANWDSSDVVSAKARLRCMTPDHLPMVGAMPDIEAHKIAYAHLRKDKNWKFEQAAPIIDNLYLMTGLGARGLCSAPLIADILAADICGTPYPVDTKTLFNLAPNRFIIRDLIKRKI